MTLTALTPEQSVCVLIDVQDKLAARMHERESLFDHLRRLLAGVRRLGAAGEIQERGGLPLERSGCNVGRQAGGRRAAGLVIRRNGQSCPFHPRAGGSGRATARTYRIPKPAHPAPQPRRGQGAAASAPLPLPRFSGT